MVSLVAQGFPSGASGKKKKKTRPANAGDIRMRSQGLIRGFNPWVRKILWRRTWQPTPVFLSEESHGQGSLAG